jgi:hypothetical protein
LVGQVGFCLSEVESSHAETRKKAIEVLAGLYQHIGPPLRSLALPEDMKPALKQTIEAEFQKVR